MTWNSNNWWIWLFPFFLFLFFSSVFQQQNPFVFLVATFPWDLMANSMLPLILTVTRDSKTRWNWGMNKAQPLSHDFNQYMYTQRISWEITSFSNQQLGEHPNTTWWGWGGGGGVRRGSNWMREKSCMASKFYGNAKTHQSCDKDRQLCLRKTTNCKIQKKIRQADCTNGLV